MNKYDIRIDGEQLIESYTYLDLVEEGLFELEADDLNGIEVKKTTDHYFVPLKSYYFLESKNDQEDGEKASQDKEHNGAYVDEFGQIIRQGSDSHTSLLSSDYSSDNDGWRMSKSLNLVMVIIMLVGLILAMCILIGN